MNRRNFLVGLGIGGLAAGGSLLVMGGDDRRPTDHGEGGGPPNVDDWRLAFEDRFEREDFGSGSWGVGWGWGWYTSTSPTRISPDNVSIRGEKLRLRGTHAGNDIVSGAVNTKNRASFGPGSYVEARIKFARRTGFLNAFWAKPISEVWPPEIDIVELFQSGDGSGGVRQTQHHIHYSTSTQPGDASTHRSVDATSTTGRDLTEAFHVYGFEWRDDRVVHYVDGNPVSAWTDETILQALDIGVPFYLMLSLNIGNYGDPDLSEPWGEEMVIDWVRIWEREPE